MSAIVIFGGTMEGRKIAEYFAETEIQVFICVATEYGGTLLPKSKNITVHTGRMEEEEILSFLQKTKPDFCLDATHPYAAVVTKNVRNACQRQKISYIRIRREENSVMEGASIHAAETVEAAAAFLAHTQGNIFITTGSKELEKYTRIPDYKNRCTARVLPTEEVVKKCRELGFEGKNLICMQGPFDEEMNLCMMKQTHTAWLVTKNSGSVGGYQEKCEAALRIGAGIVVIGRPDTDSSLGENERILSLKETILFLQKQYHMPRQRRQIFLIGMGPGNENLLTQQAECALQECDVLIGAERMLAIWKKAGTKPCFCAYRKEDIRKYLEEHPEYEKIALLYSGDIGFYSGAKGMEEEFSDFQITRINGISSSVYLLDKIGCQWEDVRFASMHGQETNLISLIRSEKKVCAILGKKDTVSDICQKLSELQMQQVKVTVGQRLSYPEEQIISGYPKDFVGIIFDPLSVAVFENPAATRKKCIPGRGEDEFIRANVPMTKEEIRVLSLSKLKLTRQAVVYDIGAGTGSVSIEAAECCLEGIVYAIEKNPEALRLIAENKKKFGVENLVLVEGTAPQCLGQLPKPTHVFIGGSGGHLLSVIEKVREKNPSARFVLNAVTLETIGELKKIKEQFPEYQDMEIISVQVNRSQPLGHYQFLKAENPVYIVSFGGDRGRKL